MNTAVRMHLRRGPLVLAVSLALAACGRGDSAKPDALREPGKVTTAGRLDVAEQEDARLLALARRVGGPYAGSREVNSSSDGAPFGSALERGTYFVDPDSDPATPLRVHFTIAGDDWKPPWGDWNGVVKDVGGGERGELLVSITTVTNVVQDGCVSDIPADPPIGPSVDDLAEALAALPPFDVVSPPSDVTAYGYQGKHLEWTVPETVDVSRCLQGNLRSWIAPFNENTSFYGYGGLTGTSEEFWILDVDGTRLVIEAMRKPGATPQHLAELRAILNSIRIER